MDNRSIGLLAGVPVEVLRRKVQRPPLDAVYKRMVARWREAALVAARGEEPPYHASLGWQSVTPMAMEATFIWRASGEADALKYVENRIEALDRFYREQRDKWLPVLSHGQIALAADMCRDGLNAGALQAVCRLARERMIDCHDVNDVLHGYGGGRNTPVCQLINAAIAALTFGEESGHPDWERVVSFGRDACVQYLRRGADENGYPYEGTGYGFETFYYIYLFAQLLHQTGRENLFESEPNLRNIPLAGLTVMLPDRSALTNINDLGLIFPWSMPYLLLTAKHYGRGVDVGLWNEFQGFDHPLRPAGDVTPWYKQTFGEVTRGFDHMPSLLLTILWWEPDLPCQDIEAATRPTANCSHGVEMANFRTSWRREATYLNVLGSGRSHTSAGHAHADCGHFSIFARGEYLAVDTGRYNVDENYHNVVLVDGKCHMPQPERQWGYNLWSGRLRSFRRDALVDYVVADAAHMKDCIWADRHVLFVRVRGDDAYIVTLDNINKDYGRHSFWWQLHANPEATVQVTGPRSAIVLGRRSALDVTFLHPGPEDYPDPHALELRTDTCYWAYGKQEQPGVEAARTGLLVTSYEHPRLVAALTGANCLLMAVMTPRGLQESAPSVRPVAARSIMRAEVDLGDIVDTIIAAPDHGRIRQDDVEGNAQLAIIRRDKAGNVIATWSSDGAVLLKR